MSVPLLQPDQNLNIRITTSGVTNNGTHFSRDANGTCPYGYVFDYPYGAVIAVGGGHNPLDCNSVNSVVFSTKMPVPVLVKWTNTQHQVQYVTTGCPVACSTVTTSTDSSTTGSFVVHGATGGTLHLSCPTDTDTRDPSGNGTQVFYTGELTLTLQAPKL